MESSGTTVKVSSMVMISVCSNHFIPHHWECYLFETRSNLFKLILFLNKSTQKTQISLARTARYPHIAQIPNLESQRSRMTLKKIINCFLYHCKALPIIWSKFANKLLSNGQIPNWTVNMVTQMTTKIQSLVPFTALNQSIKIHRNLFITFWVMLLTNRQTNPCYQKHNLLAKEVTRTGHWHMTICALLWTNNSGHFWDKYLVSATKVVESNMHSFKIFQSVYLKHWG